MIQLARTRGSMLPDCPERTVHFSEVTSQMKVQIIAERIQGIEASRWPIDRHARVARLLNKLGSF